MNKKVIITICGAVIISSVLSISKCNSFSNNHKEINIITTTSPKSNYFIIPDSNTHYLTPPFTSYIAKFMPISVEKNKVVSIYPVFCNI